MRTSGNALRKTPIGVVRCDFWARTGSSAPARLVVLPDVKSDSNQHTLLLGSGRRCRRGFWLVTGAIATGGRGAPSFSPRSSACLRRRCGVVGLGRVRPERAATRHRGARGRGQAASRRRRHRPDHPDHRTDSDRAEHEGSDREARVERRSSPSTNFGNPSPPTP